VICDATGTQIASVKRNQIYRADRDLYSVEGTPNTYKLIEKSSGRVLCEINRQEGASPAELDVSVELYTPDGFLFKATPTQTNIGGITMINNVFSGGRCGISIG
jgi:hypothetical protein